MLIINADDWGRDRSATDTALVCHQNVRISSVSGMVFMSDSNRAAELANSNEMDVGLHINFTERFNGASVSKDILAHQDRIRRFLKADKYALLFYHPFLTKSFQFVFDAQLDEFLKIYGRCPSHFDGHQHMHLATNMLMQKIIPAGQKVRRSFSFQRFEKNLFNRTYRRLVDQCLLQRYRLADSFFALAQHLDPSRLASILTLARKSNVEIMTHTWNRAEFECLMGDVFPRLSKGIDIGNYTGM